MILKLNKGTVEKLLQWKSLKADQSKNLSGGELTLEVKDKEIVMQMHEDKFNNWLELADVNGSFGLWIQLTKDKYQKLKGILAKGP